MSAERNARAARWGLCALPSVCTKLFGKPLDRGIRTLLAHVYVVTCRDRSSTQRGQWRTSLQKRYRGNLMTVEAIGTSHTLC